MCFFLKKIFFTNIIVYDGGYFPFDFIINNIFVNLHELALPGKVDYLLI